MFEPLSVNHSRLMLINLRYPYSCKSTPKKFNLIQNANYKLVLNNRGVINVSTNGRDGMATPVFIFDYGVKLR